jgi:transcriptional regulator with XRE-family HTH domain
MAGMANGESEIGRKLREIRLARGKSLAVIAGLAGISTGYLSRLEHGERALDRRSLIIKLATALDVAPSEITSSALATPGKQDDDRGISAVRLALLGVSMDEPAGEIQEVEQLAARVTDVLAALNECRAADVGAALPALIRDLHTTLATGQRDRELLPLVTLAHMQGTQAWLTMVGAPLDLSWQAATMARHAAERLGEPVSLALSAFGTSLGLLGAGAVDLAASTVTAVDLPLVASEHLQLDGTLALASSLIAAAQGNTARRAAALEYAAELAERTGETNSMALGFGPSNVAVWRMQGALEVGEYGEAARIAETVVPAALTVRARQSVYWREYGRALARLPRRQDSAVLMLRRAEQISPEHVHRHPFTRSLLAELVARARQDAVGRELRGLAYRAGLHV